MTKRIKQAGLVFATTMATIAFAQVGNVTSLYVGEYSIAEQKLTLTPWGNGTIAETEDSAFNGTKSIRVSSRNLYQGGSINMQNAVDLSSQFSAKDSLLQFAVRAPKSTGSGAPSGVNAGTGRGAGNAGGGGPAGGSGAGSGSGDEGGGGRGGDEPTRGGSGPGGGTPATAAEASSITKLRFIFTTSDSKKSELILPVTTSRLDDRGWQTLSLPLQAISGFSMTNKMVKSISVAADYPATFYVGEVRMTTDSTPIYGDMTPREENVGSNSVVNFTANGDAGSSILKYTWDFDSSNGIEPEAEGQAVSKRFRKPGTYTVTLTISDYFNLKKPFVSTSKITVN